MFRKIKKGEEWEKRHFDTMAESYERKYGYQKSITKHKINTRVDSFVKTVKEKYGNNAGVKILELGCGTGFYTARYASKLPNAEITAIDISKGMISLAAKKKMRKNINYQVKSAYHTGFKKSSVDVVCGFYVLHHLDIKITSREIYRILKPGGLAFFYEPNILNPAVYLIKRNKKIKYLVGDTPGEWAINPLTISKTFGMFHVEKIKSGGFLPPLLFGGSKLTNLINDTADLLGILPIIKYLGASLEIKLMKVQ